MEPHVIIYSILYVFDFTRTSYVCTYPIDLAKVVTPSILDVVVGDAIFEGRGCGGGATIWTGGIESVILGYEESRRRD